MMNSKRAVITKIRPSSTLTEAIAELMKRKVFYPPIPVESLANAGSGALRFQETNLVIVSGSPYRKTIQIWDGQTGELAAEAILPQPYASAVCCSPCGDQIALGFGEGSVAFYESESLDLLRCC